jgi:hypothetical protein
MKRAAASASAFAHARRCRRTQNPERRRGVPLLHIHIHIHTLSSVQPDSQSIVLSSSPYCIRAHPNPDKSRQTRKRTWASRFPELYPPPLLFRFAGRAEEVNTGVWRVPSRRVEKPAAMYAMVQQLLDWLRR